MPSWRRHQTVNLGRQTHRRFDSCLTHQMKENIKPVRTERSGNLHAVVNDPAGRKSDVATC